MGDPWQHEVVLLRQSHWVRRAGAALACLAVAAELLDAGHERFFWILGAGTLGVSLIVVGGEGLVRRSVATVDAGGIRVGGQVVAERSTLRSGWIERTGDSRVVHFDRGARPDVTVEVSDDARADDLLRRLARDPLARFPAMSRLSFALAIVWGQLMAHALLGHDRVTSTVAACLLLAVALLRAFWRDDVSVGSDGVLLSTHLSRRFLPFAEIESVTAVGGRKVVLLTRRGGRVERWLKAAAARVFVERVESALGERERCPEADRAPLRRHGSDVPLWLGRLQALAQREPYRAPGPSIDALWRVVDDPGADESERAAAAVVLGSRGNQEVRVRLHGAAARMVSPRLRVAIERAAERAAADDADDLIAAMAAIALGDAER
ncbi:MAG TPA: hypothetical protein VKU41_13525 [Polyangiaceae bacterium]|nr:hypothetical protein [Polyangiaceae bacterium]